jgi:hypothetical protein
MSNERHRTRDLEQLSAYLDHALNDRQIRQLESRLQREPALREQLENLRQTKLLMSQLPRMRAPRNFTLTPDMVKVRQPQKRPMFFSLKLATSLAAIFLVALFGVEFILGGNLAERTHMASEPMAEVAQMDAAEKPAPLIIWSEGGQGGGAESSGFGMGGGGEEMILEAPAPEEQVEAEALPKEAPEALEESVSQADEESAARAADSAGINPILGLNPDEGGQIIESSKPGDQIETAAPNWTDLLRWAQFALAVLAVGGSLTLLVLHTKRVRNR